MALSGRYSNPLRNRSTEGEGEAISEAPPEHRQRQTHRRLTDDQVDDLVSRYQGGCTIPELVAEFQIHRTTVSGLLKKRGVETRVLRRRMTDADVELAASLYSTGESLAAIGKRFGVYDSTVLREFRKAGIETRPRPGSS